MLFIILFGAPVLIHAKCWCERKQRKWVWSSKQKDVTDKTLLLCNERVLCLCNGGSSLQGLFWSASRVSSAPLSLMNALMESDRSLPCSLGCSDLPTSPSGWSTGHVVLCATSVNILYRVTVEMNSLSSKRVNRCGPKSQDTYGYRFTSGSYVNSCSVAQEMECNRVLFFSLSCVTFS